MAKYLTAPVKTKDLPNGIPYIIGNEVAERFSFYGMKVLLVVFMTTYIIQPDGTNTSFSETDAKKYYHYFNFFAYFTPFFGAILADAFLGKYRTIIALSLVYCAGHACLAFMGVMGDTRLWLFAGLLLISLGAGGIKPCVSAHVGDQFGKSNSHWLTKVYAWFYFSINVGAVVSGLLTPWLMRAEAGKTVHPFITMLVGEKAEGEILFGPHWAFGLPGVLMAIATYVFWMGRNKFIHIQPLPNPSTYFKKTFSGEGLQAFGRIAGVISFSIIFWSLFDQMASTWVYQGKELERAIPASIPFFAGEIYPEQISGVFNPMFILLFIPLMNKWGYPLIDKVFPLNPLRKIGIGLVLAGIAFGGVAFVDVLLNAGHKPHIGWQVLACALFTLAEVMISITCLEFAYTQAPKQMKSLVLSLYLLSVAMGNFVTAFFTPVFAEYGRTLEMWFWSGLVIVNALVFIPVARKYIIQEHLHEEEELEVATNL